jgi:hypothetical protein
MAAATHGGGRLGAARTVGPRLLSRRSRRSTPRAEQERVRAATASTAMSSLKSGSFVREAPLVAGSPKRRAKREAAGDLVAPRGYSWEPFKPRNEVAVRHGADSPRSYGPRATELEQQIYADASWPRRFVAHRAVAVAHSDHSLIVSEYSERENQRRAPISRPCRSRRRVRARPARAESKSRRTN